MESKNDGKYILSLDIGTTTVRCFLFNKCAEVVGRCSTPLKMLYPEHQAVEIDPDSLWEQILFVIKGCIENASIKPSMIASMGISSQRATFILWDAASGKPFHNFIVWQDTRSEDLCSRWNNAYTLRVIRVASRGLHTVTQRKKFLAAAVLRFIPQQVSMRLLWLFQKYPLLREIAEDGKVRFGTLDTWVIWKLTSGKVYASEYSCASSTGLYDPYILEWSGFFCSLLSIPMKILPPVKDTNGDFGECDPEYFGAAIPIRAAVGDQQAGMFGECCFSPGDLKLTMGTGAFLDLNMGTNPHASMAGFYPLIGWKIGPKVTHIVEGSSSTAGNAIEWLKCMNFIKEPSETEEIAKASPDSDGVYFVPAFNGLQAPVMDYLACGSIMGITQATKPHHIVRAALESLAFRNKQLFEAMKSEVSLPFKRFFCDGGVSANVLVVQLTADLIGESICVPLQTDTSALGAAFLAGLAVGFWKNESELKELVKVKQTFRPNKEAAQKYAPIMKQWCNATKRSMKWYAE